MTNEIGVQSEHYLDSNNKMKKLKPYTGNSCEYTHLACTRPKSLSEMGGDPADI